MGVSSSKFKSKRHRPYPLGTPSFGQGFVNGQQGFMDGYAAGYGQAAGFIPPQPAFGGSQKKTKRKRPPPPNEPMQFPGGFVQSGFQPQPQVPAFRPEGNHAQQQHANVNAGFVPPPGMTMSQGQHNSMNAGFVPPPGMTNVPPLFTPTTGAPPLHGFASPMAQTSHVGDPSGRRAQTPFNTAESRYANQRDEGHGRNNSGGRAESDAPRGFERANQPVHPSHPPPEEIEREPDLQRILRPMDPPHPSAFGPSNPIRAPLSNPLPPPPRDLYELTPYKNLLNLPQTTALLTATLSQQPAPQQPQKKPRKGLFGLKSRKPEPPNPLENVRIIPVFVPQPQAPPSSHGHGAPSVSRSSSSAMPPPISRAVPAAHAAPVVPPPGQMHRDASTDTTSSSSSVSSHFPPLRFDQTSEYASFMNHSPFRILYRNVVYPTGTHLHEALKYLDHRPDLAERIRQTADVADVYPLSASFQKHQRQDWNEVYLDVMEEVLWTKFTQHPNLRALIDSTGRQPLIYSDPHDAFWGDGPNGTGANELGKALVRVRDKLRMQHMVVPP